jgi:hypothetical protein
LIDEVDLMAEKFGVSSEEAGPFALPTRRERGTYAALTRLQRDTHAAPTRHLGYSDAAFPVLPGYPRFKERRTTGAHRPQQAKPNIAISRHLQTFQTGA